MKLITLQCRGPEGRLEKDVGVVVGTDITGIIQIVHCPYYKKPDKCAVESMTIHKYGFCFLYKD